MNRGFMPLDNFTDKLVKNIQLVSYSTWECLQTDVAYIWFEIKEYIKKRLK
jgi:hypothetical protein